MNNVNDFVPGSLVEFVYNNKDRKVEVEKVEVKNGKTLVSGYDLNVEGDENYRQFALDKMVNARLVTATPEAATSEKKVSPKKTKLPYGYPGFWDLYTYEYRPQALTKGEQLFNDLDDLSLVISNLKLSLSEFVK